MDYYPPRIYELSLHTVGLIVGLFLLAIHLFALLRPKETQAWLAKLPRSKSFGIFVLALDAVWCFWLATNMDLGEFSGFRRLLQICIPVLAVLTVLFVDEFLSARALGILALLVAEPILSAAFLRPEIARLLLVILAYVWLTVGMFWIGKPYLLRDQISWLTRSATRWRIAAIAGVAYGAVVLFCTLTIF
jgi:hypothetical protein